MFERAAFCDFWRVYRRILFASFLFVAFLVQYSFGDSTASKRPAEMNYDCNSGSWVSGYTTPQLSDSNSYVTLYSGDACTRNGYDFFMWLCTFQNGTTGSFYGNGNELIQITGSNTCMAIWNESCEPGERVYTSVTGLDILPSEQPGIFADYNFAYPTGTVSVSGLCSQTTGTPQMTGNPSATSGSNCWCHVVGAQETGGQYNTISNTPWVLLNTSGDCKQDTDGQWVDRGCSYHCVKDAMTSEFSLFLNNLMFTSSCVYPTLTYYNCEQQTGYTSPPSVGGSTQFNGTLESSCIPPSGMVAASNYTFGGWYCVPQGGGDAVSVTGSPWSYNLTSDTDCYAIWNEVNPCDPGTESSNSSEVLGVLYDGNLNSKWGPDITFSDLFNPTSVINGGPAENTFTNGTSSWTVAWDKGLCSSSAGELYHAGAPNETPNSGNFCWCRVRSVIDVNNEMTPLNNYPYVFFGSLSNCTAAQCQELCDEVEGGAKPQILSLILEALYTKTMCRYQINWDCNNSEADEPHSYIQSVDAGTTNIATYGDCGVPPNSSFGSWSCVTATTNESVTVNGLNQIEEMPWDNVNCIASWNSLPTYTVTYNCNNGVNGQSSLLDNGSDHTPNTAYWYDDDVTLWTQSGNSVGSCIVPDNQVFAGWFCAFDPSGDTPSAEYDSTDIYHTVIHLVNYTDNGTAISVDNVICEANWACDSANGYIWNNSTGECSNEYKIYYNTSNGGHYSSGTNQNSTGNVYGPGASSGGITFGQTWSTQALSATTIEPDNACYDFCGWSQTWNDTCGNATVLSQNTQQPVWNTILSNDFAWITLYATWQCASGCMSSNGQCVPAYTLTYVANAPTGVTVSGMPTPNPVTSLPAGATPTLAAGPTATSGYIFDHWDCEDANQNTITITNNSITMPSSNVTCYAQWTQTQYTITYTCGDAGGTMSSNTNTVNIGQASYTVKPNVTGCDSYNGYHFTGWLCTPDLATGTGTATYSNTYPTNPDVSKTIATIGLSGNATCVAQWGQNIVNLLWNDNGATTPHSGTQSDSCLYGPGDITIPTTPPTRTGYSFSGWKVTDWWHRLLDRFTDNVRGTCYCYRHSNNNWGYTGPECHSVCYSAPDNMWGLRYHNNDATGIIIGTATCSNQSTTLYTTGDPGATSGQYCWCRVTSYTRGDISEQYNNLPWVYAYDFSSGDCNSSPDGCLEKCGSILHHGNNSTFQNALFGQ